MAEDKFEEAGIIMVDIEEETSKVKLNYSGLKERKRINSLWRKVTPPHSPSFPPPSLQATDKTDNV